MVAEIRITRSRLEPVPGRALRVAWKWTYDYSVDGAPPVQYGTSLASLRERLRRKFPTAEIVKDWEI